ncbi:hypothetical protein HPS57_09160 [Prevotella sp. PINT]|jgi:hypothetical protein|uniref:hypothetical protein n=1 Tax=Palleniella intestinalis TaxID=2736291 RepID=UPI001557B141|nr:hypothetical protein [Palleniella intestinalis]NPD82138.1 hypothetical protein [Palleniella intestinalis]
MENEDRLMKILSDTYRKMLERKARLGELVHTDDGTGKMRTQRAIDVYHRVYGELPSLNNTTV